MLYALGWNLDELSKLNQKSRSLLVEVTTLRERVDSPPIAGLNYTVNKLQSSVKEFIRAVSRHQRTPATHVLVTMISPSERNRKPYALPLCCIPYVGLNESQARSHIHKVAKEMSEQGMHVEGLLVKFPLHFIYLNHFVLCRFCEQRRIQCL